MSDKFLLDLPVSNPTYASDSPQSFKLAPWDGSLTLPQIYDWHFVHNPRHTVFIYEAPTAGYVHLTYREVMPAAYRAAAYIANAISVDLNNVPANIAPVAIVATSGQSLSHRTFLPS